jgi:hypothetical protein
LRSRNSPGNNICKCAAIYRIIGIQLMRVTLEMISLVQHPEWYTLIYGLWG